MEAIRHAKMRTRGRSYVRPKLLEGVQPTPILYREWMIETTYSLFGTIRVSIKEGIYGTPVVDQVGRVAGIFSLVDQSGIYGKTGFLESS